MAMLTPGKARGLATTSSRNGVFAILAEEVGENQVPYFVGIDKAKFRKPVLPGDVLILALELQKVRRGIYYFLGQATVDGKLVAEAELKATFVDK